jgi:RecA/RadA recombinase
MSDPLSDSVRRAIKLMTTKPAKTPKPADSDYLSTGVTLINLATYGKTHGGLLKGHIYRFAGRSSSGKTFICRTVLAEAAMNPAFDDYELIYDDVEDGALMDTEKFFGSRLVKRLVSPSRRKGSPVYSKTIGDFYSRLNKRLDAGKKLIWVIDSLDSLSPDSANKMTDNKAKANSQEMRKLLQPLTETKSILILVSQVRANMGSPYGGDIVSGGMAPEFYATLEVILRKAKTLKTVYKKKKYVIGSIVSAKIKKNRISGREQVVFFPFSPDYGIDDIGANVDYLCQNQHWVKKEGVVQAEEFNFTGKRMKLIQFIEETGVQRELQVLVGKVWKEIRDATTVERRPRYS